MVVDTLLCPIASQMTLSATPDCRASEAQVWRLTYEVSGSSRPTSRATRANREVFIRSEVSEVLQRARVVIRRF